MLEGYDPEGDVLTPPLQAFLQACKGTDDLSACGFMQFIEREDLIVLLRVPVVEAGIGAQAPE